jgi:hypothetical protein
VSKKKKICQIEFETSKNWKTVRPGAKPTIASYNATRSLERFENKNINF